MSIYGVPVVQEEMGLLVLMSIYWVPVVVQEEMGSLGLQPSETKGTKQALSVHEFFPKVEDTSGDVGWRGVPLLWRLDSRGPKDQVFFAEEPEAEQSRKGGTGLGRRGRGCFGVGSMEVINWGLSKQGPTLPSSGHTLQTSDVPRKH